MTKYIELEAAINACYNGFADCRDDCVANIKAIPAADVAPVRHGRWIKHYIEASDPHDRYDWQCSICATCNSNQTNYCPNCGARMDGNKNG